MCFAFLYVYASCVYWCLQKLEEVLNPLELGLQMVLSCHVGTRNKPGNSGRETSVLDH